MPKPGAEFEIQPAERMAGIAPFYVMDILARARAMEAGGRTIIHMEVGEPDFSTPQPVIEAGIAALQAGKTHYTPATGIPELRQAISDYYREHYGVPVEPGRILITPGASGALQLVLAALVNPGDKVLMPDPGYPCNRHMVRLFNGVAVELGVKARDQFKLAPDQVLGVWDERTRALMIASPANPTGRMLDSGAMDNLYQAVRVQDGALIVDEIYQGLVYEQTPHTALSLGEQGLFVVNSFSKYFGMTGWRLGWVVAPGSYVPLLDRLAQNIYLAPPTMAQYGALAAFQPQTLEILEQRKEVFRQRRDYLYSELGDLGFKLAGQPEGAFYIYADVSPFSDDSFEFAARLLEEAGVAITPGRDFGAYRQQRFARFAYTTGMAQLEEGVQRIRKFCRASKAG